jgi:hypothetical protein
LPDDVAENVGPTFREDLAFTLRLLPGDVSSPPAYDAEAYRGRVLAASDVLRGYGLHLHSGNWSQHQALRIAAGALAAAVALVAPSPDRRDS